MENKFHDEILELVPAYALNSLDKADAELVSQHLVDCVYCQDELAAYQAVVDILPLAVSEAAPSPELKNTLMTRIASEPAAVIPSTAVPGVSPEPGPGVRAKISEAFTNFFAGPRWRPVALLLILAVIVGSFLVWLQEFGPAADEADWQQIVLAGTEFAPSAKGLIYISADGRNGTLIVDGLPELNPEQQYQLWLIEDGQRESGGVFSVGADGYRSIQIGADEALNKYTSFGITIEPAGGSPGPTGERVLGYNL